MNALISFLKRFVYCTMAFLSISQLYLNALHAQVAPYTVSPRWMVGRTSGMSFVNAGNVIGPPMNMTGNPAANNGQESTSTLCLPNKDIFLYCNNAQIYNNVNGLISNVNATNGQSSTQGAVTVPDPANANRAYVFTGNDQTGGNQGGINWYHIQEAAGVYSVLSGPTSIAADADVSESLVVSANGNGGYWVISHTKGSTLYRSWPVTAGGVGAQVTSPSSSRGGFGAGGTIKISKCQTKIALIGPLEVEVYNWDRTTGQTGTIIGFSGLNNGPSSGYGGEFSPDGNILYLAGLNGSIQQWDLSQPYATGRITITGTTNIGGMTLGPDDRIYIARSSTAIAAINSPNSVGDAACGYTASALTVTGLGPFINLANNAWLNPTLPTINRTITCLTVDFSILFQTYFLDNITINVPSIEWNFGSGGGWVAGLGATPSFTYPSSGTYTAQVRFNDATCVQQWTASRSITVSCVPAPVNLISFTGIKNNTSATLSWSTASELNNDYFELERSGDGINFYSIGTAKGNSTTNASSRYSFDDANGINGIVYYRLVQHDHSGEKNYSQVITVGNDTLSHSVFPNPSTNLFTFVFSGTSPSTLKILDIVGRVVEEKQMNEERYSIELGEKLSKGSYILVVETPQESFYHKLVKE